MSSYDTSVMQSRYKCTNDIGVRERLHDTSEINYVQRKLLTAYLEEQQAQDISVVDFYSRFVPHYFFTVGVRSMVGKVRSVVEGVHNVSIRDNSKEPNEDIANLFSMIKTSKLETILKRIQGYTGNINEVRRGSKHNDNLLTYVLRHRNEDSIIKELALKGADPYQEDNTGISAWKLLSPSQKAFFGV